MPSTRDLAGIVPEGLLRRSEINPFYQRGWPGGWVPDLGESQVGPDSIIDLLNVEFTEGYGLKKRKGYEKITDDIAGQDQASHVLIQPVQTIDTNYPRFEQMVFHFNLDDGEMYYQSLGNLVEEFELGGGADLIDSTHSIGDFVPDFNGPRPWSITAFTFGTSVYFISMRTGGTSSNGGVLQTLDGSTVGSTKAIVFDRQTNTITRPDGHNLDGSTTGVPVARTALTKYERVFYANLSFYDGAAGSDPTYEYRARVYWTDPGTAQTIQSTSYITVGTDDDGSDIVALLSFREQILIFKLDSIWTLVGTDEDTFALYSLSQNIGLDATHACLTDGDLAYFFDPTRGVMTYDGARFTNISEQINGVMLGELNYMSSFKSVMWQDDSRLYLSIPVGAIGVEDDDLPTVTYVFDKTLGVWSRFDIGYTPGVAQYKFDTYITPASASAPDGAYYGGVYDGTAQGVMKLNEGDSDGGSAISAYFSTAWFNPGEIGDVHRLRRLEALMGQFGENVTVDLYRDFNESEVWSTGTVDPDASGFAVYHSQDPTRDTGFFTWLRVRFSNSTVDETFRVEGVGLNYSSRHQRRGRRGRLNTGE